MRKEKIIHDLNFPFRERDRETERGFQFYYFKMLEKNKIVNDTCEIKKIKNKKKSLRY